MKHLVLATTIALALAGTASLAVAKGPGDHGPRGHHGGDRLAALDADGDGRISAAEFAAGEAKRAERRAAFEAKRAADGKAAPDRAGRGERPQPPTFAELDANRDGYVVRREVEAHAERMRPQREAEMARRKAEVFAAADLNKDGRLSRIEAEEKMPRLAKRFAWLDDNRDGFLSQQELRGPRDR